MEENKWLIRMWNRKLHWVPAYLNCFFIAGMTTIGRSESINAYFDGFVNANAHLFEFIK